MKVLVCITHVPDTTARIAFTPDGKALEKQGVPFIIGPYDDYALARAVELKEATEAEVVVLTVDEVGAEASLRKALAIGADKAIRIDASPLDSYFVAQQIAALLKETPFDLVMMGRETIDFNGGVVHGMVSAISGVQAVSPVMRLELNGRTAQLQCEIEGGTEEIEAELPLILGCQEPIADWKIPNMRGIMMARSKPLEVRPAFEIEARAESITFSLLKPRANVKLLKTEQAEELVTLLQEEAKVL